MEQIHAFDTGKSGEHCYPEVAVRYHPSEYFEMFVRVSEAHSRFMERIFQIEDILIA